MSKTTVTSLTFRRSLLFYAGMNKSDSNEEWGVNDTRSTTAESEQEPGITQNHKII